MITDKHRIVALEQALYAAMSAAEQYGIHAEDLRLLAIGGLSLNASWRWVNDDSTERAEIELTNAVEVVRTHNF